MKITGKPYLAIRRRRRQQQLEHSRRILSSSSSQSLPLCSCVSACWVFYLLSAFLFCLCSLPLCPLFSLLLSLLRKVMDMPAFSKFFTDFGFFLFLICRGRGDCEDDGINVGFLGLLLVCLCFCCVYCFFCLCFMGFFCLCWVFFFLWCACVPSPGVGFSSPFYREDCPSTSTALAGLLWNPRPRSWARDGVMIGFVADFPVSG